MVERKPAVVSGSTGFAGPRAASANSLSPKDILVIFRRHLLLIFFLSFLGCVLGGGGWYLLRKYLPKYTAQTLIKVLPPVEKDPMEILAMQVNKDIQYGFRVSMANLIKQQSNLQELLRNDKVRRTKWYAPSS